MTRAQTETLIALEKMRRPTSGELAKKMGLKESTVRSRLKRMLEQDIVECEDGSRFIMPNNVWVKVWQSKKQ